MLYHITYVKSDTMTTLANGMLLDMAWTEALQSSGCICHSREPHKQSLHQMIITP